MTEEEFYKKKIFDKVGINLLKQQFPNLENSIKLWYKSDRYNKIQNYKSFLTNKLKQMTEDGKNISFNNEQLYNFFQWWETTSKVCYYCSLQKIF